MKAIKIFLFLGLMSSINVASAFTGGFGKDKKPTNNKSTSILAVNKSNLSNKLFAYKPINKHVFLNTPAKFNTPLYVKSTITYKKNNIMYVKPVITKINVSDKLTFDNIKKLLKSN